MAGGAAQGIVVVTVNYCVGMDGFMALAALPLANRVAATETMVTDMRNMAKWGPVGGQPPFLPVVNGTVLTAPPLAALRANAADVYAQARPSASPGDMLAALESDKTFRMPTLRYAEQRVEVGAPVWLYNFAWSSPAFEGRLGAGHVVDVPFVFNALASKQATPFLGGIGHPPLADAMHREWTRFIQKGNASWPRYELSSCPTMRFDTSSATMADRRLLWAGKRFE